MAQNVTRRCRECRTILDDPRATFCSPACQAAYEKRTGWTTNVRAQVSVYANGRHIASQHVLMQRKHSTKANRS